MAQLTAALRLLAVLTLEVGAVLLGHRLGLLPWLRVDWSDLLGWLHAAPVEDAALALLRVVALTGAWWALVTTLAYVLARACSLPLASALACVTFPVVRRVVDGAVAIATAATLATAVPSALAARDAFAQAPVAAASSAVSSAPLVPVPPPSAHAPAAGTSSANLTHVVVRGDHLWRIAAQRVGPDAPAAQVTAYWQALVERNRAHLRSGDPDLIYPGEVVVLPSLQLREEDVAG